MFFFFCACVFNCLCVLYMCVCIFQSASVFLYLWPSKHFLFFFFLPCMSLLFPLSLLSLYVYYLFSTPDTSHLVCVFLSFCVNVSCVCLWCLCFIKPVVSVSLSLILNGSINSSLSLLLAYPSHPILIVNTNMGIWETDLRASNSEGG